MSIDVYALGIVYCSVCTDEPREKVEELVNKSHPTGIQTQWRISPEPFKTGAPNGTPCHDHPATHRHYLMEC